MEHWRLKGNLALLSAFLAFILPAALIGFLAMGMVSDQKKIRANEIRDSWNRTIGREARRLEGEIAKRVNAVFGSVGARFTPISDRPAFIEALKSLFVENRGVSYPFLFAQDGEMLLPSFAASRVAAGRDWMKKWKPPVADPLWLRAERAEFSSRDPLAAIPLYLALEKRLPRQVLPDLYLAISRCYFKKGKQIQAREYGMAAYGLLAAVPPRRDRLDLHLLRHLGLVSTRMGSPREAFSHYLQLYEALASRPGELTPDLQFLRWEALDFLKNNRDIQPYLKKKRIEEIDNQVLELVRGEISLFSDLSAPDSAADSQMENQNRFLKLKEMFDPESSETLFYRMVEKQYRAVRIPAGDRVLHFRSASFQQSPVLLAFALVPERADGTVHCFGCRVQVREIADDIWPAAPSAPRFPGGTALELASPGGSPAWPGAGLFGKSRLLDVPGQSVLEGWTLRLVAADGRIFMRLAARSLRWYYTLIALLFASLALGVLLLVRHLGSERKLLRQKADFVDMASHTLKTPLTRLRLLAEKLEHGWTAEPGKTREQCRAIADETANMAQLVDRMLDFSALQSGGVCHRFETHSVREWLEGVLQKFKLPLEEKGFQVRLDIEAGLPPVRIDPESMGTAVSNLMENAMQHAASGRHLGICAAARGGDLEVAVIDSGPGIPRKDRARLFEPFFHGSEAKKDKGAGRGLGLAISRRIVEAHGGAIRVEDGPDQGARLVISLPFAR